MRAPPAPPGHERKAAAPATDDAAAAESRRIFEEMPKCPYCKRPAALVDGGAVYPSRPDLRAKWFWMCWGCDAWVGCHDGTKKALGRLADAALRRWKKAAHAAFDPLWQAKIERDGCKKHEARNAGYAWLAKQLGIEAKDCHIGMFDVAQCQRVVEICEKVGSK